MKLLIPLFFALAHGSCYDYEYYDPGTGASVPGNACAAQAAKAATAAAGTTVVAQAAPQTFGATTAFSAPATTAFATTSYGVAAAPVASTIGTYGVAASTPAYGVAASTFATSPVYSSNPVVFSSAPALSTVATPVYGTSTISTPIYGTSTISAPTYGAAAVTVRAPAVAVNTQARSAASTSQLSPELQYYKELGERQAQQHKRNTRIVNQAAKDLSKSSLVNQLVAGSGNVAPFYPAVRLSYQKDVADAYKSEKRIANKNAEDAYQRYQKDPSRVNLLVSKYQDLNADLRDAAYQYNVINSGTFGQRVARSGLFGSILGGGLLNSVTQIVTQRQQSEDLQDIQRQMQRVQRQLQIEVQAAARQTQGASAVSPAQGSVQQRMMAMSVYGPAQPQRG